MLLKRGGTKAGDPAGLMKRGCISQGTGLVGFAMLDGWIRRRIVWYTKRGQVTTWRGKRSGECVRCGRCCQGCPVHDAKGRRCKIYRVRPNICKAFPLTPEDIRTVRTCGYHFRN